MKRPNFLEGVAVALAASIGGGVLISTLAAWIAGGLVIRLVIGVIAFIYVLYLLRRSRERLGRVVVVAGWLLAAGVIGFLHPPLPVYLLLHAGLIWLVRSLYFYGSALSSVADLGLTGMGLAAAAWALGNTGSLLLGLWCFFLVQALFAAIPRNLARKRTEAQATAAPDERFRQAHQAADAALRKLSSIH
jgi:hypothetical protein